MRQSCSFILHGLKYPDYVLTTWLWLYALQHNPSARTARYDATQRGLHGLEQNLSDVTGKKNFVHIERVPTTLTLQKKIHANLLSICSQTKSACYEAV